MTLPISLRLLEGPPGGVKVIIDSLVVIRKGKVGYH